MAIVPKLIQRNAPGVYVSEATYGATPAKLANHSAVYVLGTCTSSTFPFNTPIYISNFEDFTTQCISSPSSAAVKLFFDQRSGSGLYFIRVAPRQQATLNATTFTPGTVLTFTLSGINVTYTCVTGDTALTATDKLGQAIGSQLSGIVSYYRESPTVAHVRTVAGSTPTVGTGLTLGAPAVNTTPRALDVADSIKFSFVPEHEQGYLCAPEFFQAFTLQSERTALQLQMESLCADPKYYWVAVIDFGQATVTNTFAVNAAQVERLTFVSPRGNSATAYPYLVTNADVIVPSSLAVIGVALRRARAEGFIQPPAGVNYPIYGVKGTTVNITADMQEQLNPRGINCIRTLPARGVVVYGARTLSPDPYYTFLADRVILNVLAGTLRSSFDSAIFSLVDGMGALLSRIKQTSDNVCEILRLAGGLYGATPQEAYLNVCDLTNNTLEGLQTGTANLECIAKISPTLEALNVTLSKASLSTVLVEVVASGDTSEKK